MTDRMTLTGENVRELVSVAKPLIRSMGKDLRQSWGGSARIVGESGRDIKVVADFRSHEELTTGLTAATHVPVISEEANPSSIKLESGLRWILDPLDGTFNYARSVPFCCISLGLWNGAEPIAGIVFDFTRDDLFHGWVAGGAWLNDVVMRVRSWPGQSQAVLATGFPVGQDYGTAALSRFVQQIQRFKKIRMFGSAALALAYVAAGRVDAYFEVGVRLWDIAGGVPLVQAAGGTAEVKPLEGDLFALYAASGGESLIPPARPG